MTFEINFCPLYNAVASTKGVGKAVEFNSLIRSTLSAVRLGSFRVGSVDRSPVGRTAVVGGENWASLALILGSILSVIPTFKVLVCMSTFFFFYKCMFTRSSSMKCRNKSSGWHMMCCILWAGWLRR